MVTQGEEGPGLSQDSRCVCGAVHRIPLDRVVISEDATEELVAYLKQRRWSRPFVVMDANTQEVAGAATLDELSRAGLRATTLCFAQRSGLRVDESTVSRLERELGEADTDSIISVGSGVLTDLTRYVAAGLSREFVSVPTAASMDGYASGVAVVEFGGMKKSYPADPPVAIFAAPRTLAGAPVEMTRAGIGDLLGKATSSADWLACHVLYGEERCPEVARLVTDSFTRVANEVGEILGGSPPATARLLNGLVESGTAIAMVGSSRPASGSEHELSHFWDLLAADGRRPHTAHGLQVGYATHFAMRLQLDAFGGGVRRLLPPRPLVLGDELQAWFPGHAAQVQAVTQEKQRFIDERASSWAAAAANWEVVRDQIREALEVFPLVAGALSAAGIPAEPGYLEIDEGLLKASLRWANRIRSRYTVLDFLEGQGRLDETIEAAVVSEPGRADAQ